MNSDKLEDCQDEKSTRRKPFKMIRVKDVIASAAARRAAQMAQDTTQYVNDAIRMRLELEGQWEAGVKPAPVPS